MTSYDEVVERNRKSRAYSNLIRQYRGVHTRGHLVKRVRERLGLSQDELRERMRIKSLATVPRLEGVHAPITRWLWVRLCMALEVTPEEGLSLVFAELRS